MKRYGTVVVGLAINYWPVVLVAFCDPVQPTWAVLGEALAVRLCDLWRRRRWTWRPDAV